MITGRILVLICCSSLAGCGAQTASHTPPLRSAVGAPTEGASPAATPTPLTSAANSEPAGGLGPFTCSLPITRAASGSSLAQPTTARVGGQTGFDRIVFEYAGKDLPELVVNSATPPFALDPSGKPLAVSGKVFLSIVLPKVPGISSGYKGPTSFKAGLPLLTDLEMRGDFEGVQSWVAGLSGQACARVFSLTSPSRLVVDLASSLSPA